MQHKSQSWVYLPVHCPKDLYTVLISLRTLNSYIIMLTHCLIWTSYVFEYGFHYFILFQQKYRFNKLLNAGYPIQTNQVKNEIFIRQSRGKPISTE